MSITQTYRTLTFYEGLRKAMSLNSYLNEVFSDIPCLQDKKCEDYAVIALIETIAVTLPLTPEKLNFKQRVNLLSNGEVIYTLPDETMFGWRRTSEDWIFWFTEHKPQ